MSEKIERRSSERIARVGTAIAIGGSYVLAAFLGHSHGNQESDWDRATRLVDEAYAGEGQCLKDTPFDPRPQDATVEGWLHINKLPQDDALILSVRSPGAKPEIVQFAIGPDGAVGPYTPESWRLLEERGCFSEQFVASE